MVQTIVTDLDGHSVAKREVKMRAVLLNWKQIKGEWKQVETNPQNCSVQSAADAVNCTFQSKEGGTYRVTATIQDDRGRANESELTLWVAGGKQPPKTGVTEEKVELIPDRKEYKAGDTAQILVQVPFYPAEAVMSLRRSGIVKTEAFRMDSSTYTLRVPIEEAWTPNVHVQIDIVGSEERSEPPAIAGGRVPAGAPTTDRLKPGLVPAGGTSAASKRAQKRPAFASGEINLSIPPLARKLSVTASPRDKTLEPGGSSLINVEAKDASGKPVAGGEVAVPAGEGTDPAWPARDRHRPRRALRGGAAVPLTAGPGRGVTATRPSAYGGATALPRVARSGGARRAGCPSRAFTSRFFHEGGLPRSFRRR